MRDLYEGLGAVVAGFLRVRGAVDVDAATNEVFFRAFSRLDSFSGSESNFRSWIFTIAHNLLIDEHRKRVRRPDVVASIDESRHNIVGGDVEAEAIERLATDDVDALLAMLTPGQREVLHRRLIAGLTLAETASVLRKPVGAVKSLQHRAVEVLREKFSASAYPVAPSRRSHN
jgi:RNA polymerase sigma-70 factor (ECF subfamily)